MIKSIFIRDYIPISVNVILTTNKYNRSKFKEECDVYVLAHIAGLRKLDLNGKTINKMIYEIYFDDKRKRDCDNYINKYFTDAMVRAGIIENDDCLYIREVSCRILIAQKIKGTKIIFEVE